MLQDINIKTQKLSEKIAQNLKILIGTMLLLTKIRPSMIIMMLFYKLIYLKHLG
nr:MAG TPA: hypothetical protein [Caudoviricetes sp.]